MKTLRIRQFMFLGLLLMVFLPRLFYLVTSFVIQPILTHNSQAQEALVDRVVGEIARNADRWHDVRWQNAIQRKYRSSAIAVFVEDASGKKLFQIGRAKPAPAQVIGRQLTVVEDGKVLGVIKLVVFDRNHIFAIISAALAIILAFLFIRWQMGRYVLKPLAAMSLAAKRIAKGELDFDLPMSRVTEVADVRAAFQAMRDGLRESLTRQAKLEEERRFFISAIAHDLRTPLFALRGYLLGLEQGLADTPEKMARYLSVCRQKSEQLERLVSDLFAYAKMEFMEQAAVTHRESIDVGTWLHGIMDPFRLLAQAKDVKVTIEGQAEPCLIQGDAHLLERALGNLLDNALRHTPAGGSITVRWCVEGKRVIFTIEDTGPGIPPQDLPHVFEPLYRVEKSRNPEAGGIGLGLTIAKRIFKAHGGDLAAANRIQGGAEFVGWLPLSTPLTQHRDAKAEREGKG
jgi:signal transduction histidine kinase